MAERLVSVRMFQGAPVSGTAVSGQVSSALNLRMDVVSLVALLFQASSPTSSADVRFEYAISPDNSAYGSFADVSAILTSSRDITGASTGYVTVALSSMLAPYIKFNVSGTGSNPQDTRVTADILLKMT